MSHTFEELKGKTVAELREIAAGLHEDAVKGYSQLHKEHLLELLCKALHIPMHAHHDVVGIDKSAIKGQIRELKQKRSGHPHIVASAPDVHDAFVALLKRERVI